MHSRRASAHSSRGRARLGRLAPAPIGGGRRCARSTAARSASTATSCSSTRATVRRSHDESLGHRRSNPRMCTAYTHGPGRRDTRRMRFRLFTNRAACSVAPRLPAVSTNTLTRCTVRAAISSVRYLRRVSFVKTIQSSLPARSSHSVSDTPFATRPKTSISVCTTMPRARIAAGTTVVPRLRST